MNAKIGFKKKLSRMIDIKSINSSDFISISLFNEITMFANKLVAININRNSFDINKYCVSDSNEVIKIIDDLLFDLQNVKEKIKINLKISSQQVNESLSFFIKILKSQQ